jgi:hypothetical protein
MDNQSSNKTLTSKYNTGDKSQNQNSTNKQQNSQVSTSQYTVGEGSNQSGAQSNTTNKKQAIKSDSDYDTLTANADANNYI